MDPGSIVILHLTNPTEKYWGVLNSLMPAGITISAINISSFDEWTRSIAANETPTLGLVTVFFPLTRVERMFLDEQVGEVESLCQTFEKRVGMRAEDYLGIGPGANKNVM